MNLSECEKTTFENVFLNQPSTEDVVASTNAFASLFGRRFEDSDIVSAIGSLTSRGLILLITPEHASSILKELSTVHGPLVAIPDYPHYSVTPEGGLAWLNLVSQKRGGPIQLGGWPAIEYSQLFTPSGQLAEQLSRDFSSRALRIFDVYLAPNNESQDGFVVDVFAHTDSDVSLRLVAVAHERTHLLDSWLKDHIHRVDSVVPGGFTHDELCELFRLSGFCNPRATFKKGSEARSVPTLMTRGFVCELQKEDVRQLRNRLSQKPTSVFGTIPFRKQQVLSNSGREVVVKLLQEIPELTTYLVRHRDVGSYIRGYFANEDDANEAKMHLTRQGIQTSGIERIGGWCDHWWNVRTEGARLSYWKFTTFDE